MLLKCCTQCIENVENSAVATGLEKFSFHSNPKEGQCQKQFKLPHNHFTCQQGNAHNLLSQTATVREPRTFRCKGRIQKRQRNEISNWQHLLDHRKSKRVPKIIYFCFIDYAKPFDYVNHNKLWKTLKEMGIPECLTCLLKNLYTDQEAVNRTGHGATDWFKFGKRVRQGCILSPCLFNLYAEYIM